MKEEIDSFIKAHSGDFTHADLKNNNIQINRTKNSVNFPDNLKPNIQNFYKRDLILMKIKKHIVRPKSVCKREPNTNFFIFGPNSLESKSSKTLDEILLESAPLGSVYQSLDSHSYKDPRFVTKKASTQLSFDVTMSFKSFESDVSNVEPLFVNAFILDTRQGICKQVSESWLFSLDNDERFTGILPAPNDVRFSMVGQGDCNFFIVTILRLLQKDGAETIDGLYLGNPECTDGKAMETSSRMNQMKAFSVLGFCAVPFSRIGTIGELHLADFKKASRCDGQFLKENINNKSLPSLPFRICFGLSATDNGCRRIQNLLPGQLAPLTEYKNDLIVWLKTSHFKFPPGVRGRNIYAEIRLKSGNEDQPVFGDQLFYTTLCQYHTEDPVFSDTCILRLPTKLWEDSVLYINFYHAIVKSDKMNDRDPCGYAILKLFNEQQFIENGEHEIGIGYGSEKPFISEENRITIETRLDSSIFSTSTSVISLLNRNYKECILPTKNDIIPHLYQILDIILEDIEKDPKHAFAALLSVLRLFPKDRHSSMSSPVISYITEYALRSVQSVGRFSILFLKAWLKYTEHTFKTTRKDLYCSWVLFSILTKAIILSKLEDDQHIQKIYSLALDVYEKTGKCLQWYRNESRTTGIDVTTSLALFSRDLLEIDYGMFIQSIKLFMNSIEPEENELDRTFLYEFSTYFFNPKTFVCVFTTSVFNSLFLPKLLKCCTDILMLESFFKHIFSILLMFDENEQEFFARSLSSLLVIIGAEAPYLKKVTTKQDIFHTLTIGVYISYYSEIEEFDEGIALFASVILAHSSRFNSKKNRNIGRVTIDQEGIEVLKGKYRDSPLTSSSLPMFKPVAVQDDVDDDTVKSWNALAFCAQAVCIALLKKFRSVLSFNNIFVKLFEVQIAIPLQGHFMKVATDFISNCSSIIFSKDSLVKDFVLRCFQCPSDYATSLLCQLHRINPEVVEALSIRSMFMTENWRQAAFLFENTFINKTMEKVIEIDDPVLKNLDYSELATHCLMLADIAKRSPEARVGKLLHMVDYNISAGSIDEAVVCTVCAVTCIAENLFAKGELRGIFVDKRPCEYFSPITKLAENERVEKGCMDVPGLCSSDKFRLESIATLLKDAVFKCISPRMRASLVRAVVELFPRLGLFEDLALVLNSFPPKEEQCYEYTMEESDRGRFVVKHAKGDSHYSVANKKVRIGVTQSKDSITQYFRLDMLDDGTFTFVREKRRVMVKVESLPWYSAHILPVSVTESEETEEISISIMASEVCQRIRAVEVGDMEGADAVLDTLFTDATKIVKSSEATAAMRECLDWYMGCSKTAVQRKRAILYESTLNKAASNL